MTLNHNDSSKFLFRSLPLTIKLNKITWKLRGRERDEKRRIWILIYEQKNEL